MNIYNIIIPSRFLGKNRSICFSHNKTNFTIYMTTDYQLSPNYNDRPDGTLIDTIILHYTGMETAQDALSRMCDPKAEVSAHYVILEDGEIIPLVPENKRAWHAGISHWRGKENINDTSIGIELVNPGHEFGYREFPARQMDSLLMLMEELFTRHPISVRNVVGHADIAPSRKSDPGELFNWEMLASMHMTMWPDMPADIEEKSLLKPGDNNDDVKLLQTKLQQLGYNITPDGDYSIQTCYCVVAFQRHFTPTNVGDVWHNEAELALSALLAQYS